MAAESQSLLERIAGRLQGAQTSRTRQKYPPRLRSPEGDYSPPLPSCAHELVLTDSEDNSPPKLLSQESSRAKQPEPTANLPGSVQEKARSRAVETDSSDEEFEKFLTQLKTPKTSSKLVDKQNSLKDFIVESDDDFDSVFSKSWKTPKTKNGIKTLDKGSKSSQEKVASLQLSSPVFISDSDDDSVVIKSTWRDRHRTDRNIKMDNGSKSKAVKKTGKENNSETNRVGGNETQKWPAGNQPKFLTPGSSDDEEFECLMDRIKNRTKNQTPSSAASKIKPKTAVTVKSMNSSRRSCLNDPDSFCYICGEYTLQKHRRNITDFIKKVYLAYFGVMLGDQDKSWAPHIVCKACIELLRKWSKGQRKSFKFGVPNHHDDCYFCAVQVQGFNKHKKRKWEYPNMESARRPVPHCEDVPVPVFTMLPDLPPPDDDEMQEPAKVPCFDLTNTKERKPRSQTDLFSSPYFSKEKLLKEPDHFVERTPAEKTRRLCKVEGCFLEELSCSTSIYVKSFKQRKHELTTRLYNLYNKTVFEQKLPENLEITWNKKMRKTAGYCVTGQKRPTLDRYARIELSEKVCDSADRLRDTLIHEICHAATWLINGVRDGHGQYWKLYARKSTLVHPELPMVSRCHTYEINYKFTYECSRCKNTIGRHSKSLDTEKFVCALCKGTLVLQTTSRKDGSPSVNQLNPFAKFVKENYGSTKKEMAGMSHAEVMRKLSADFSSKAKISS